MGTVHDSTYEVLRSLGMTTIFGNPGSNELPFLDRLPSDFRYILALHEGAGLAIADGYSQATGRPVFVSLHAAAGLGMAMGSLVNAQVLGTPLVIMSGQQSRAMLTLEAQLTIRDAIVIPRPLVKWSFEAPDPASVPAVIARAAHMAMAAPSGPVFVSVPLDDWHHDSNSDQTALLTARNVSARPTPPLDLLKTLADRLNSARNPLLVMGNELDTDEGWKAGVDLAEKCGAGVYLTIEAARISFPTRHPNFLGTLGTPIAAVRKQLTGHDLVIVLGAPAFRYHAWSPGSYLADGTQVVMITADPDQAARAPLGDAIVGDPVVAMEQLHRLVKPKPTKLPARTNTSASSHSGSGKITVKQFNDVLAQVCPPDAAFTSESPSLGNWWEQSFSHQTEEFLQWRRWRARLRIAGGGWSGSGIWQAACDCPCWRRLGQLQHHGPMDCRTTERAMHFCDRTQWCLRGARGLRRFSRYYGASWFWHEFTRHRFRRSGGRLRSSRPSSE